jgi:hypothetical protein
MTIDMGRTTPHSEALTHYTKSWEAIMSILQTGLKFKYCKEEFSDLFYAIPMICFCDVPISRNIEHKFRYGDFAIAFSKEFLSKNPNCRPVMYMRSEDVLYSARTCREKADNALKIVHKIFKKVDTSEVTPEVSSSPMGLILLDNKTIGTLSGQNMDKILNGLNTNTIATDAFYNSIGYIKSYSEIRRDSKEQNSREIIQNNYDECEWRIVKFPTPPFQDKPAIEWFDNKNMYQQWRTQFINKPFINCDPISFTIADIAYILVDKESNLPNYLDQLCNLKSICGIDINTMDRMTLANKIICRDVLAKYY